MCSWQANPSPTSGEVLDDCGVLASWPVMPASQAYEVEHTQKFSVLQHYRTQQLRHSGSKAGDLSGKAPIHESLHFRRALKFNEAPSCHPSHIQCVFVEYPRASVVLKTNLNISQHLSGAPCFLKHYPIPLAWPGVLEFPQINTECLLLF